MKNTNQLGFSVIDTMLGIVFVAVISLAGYFAYQNIQNAHHTGAVKTSASQSPAPGARSTSIPAGWAKFTHPTAGYSLIYPKDWKGGLGPIEGVGGAPKEFEDFYIETKDRKVAAQGVPELEQGAELYVTASKTTMSLDDTYDSNQIGAVVNRNKIATKAGGQPAIQYDYDYEQVRASVTMLEKDGVLYYITLRYVDEIGKQAFWGDYTKLVDSFKLN